MNRKVEESRKVEEWWNEGTQERVEAMEHRLEVGRRLEQEV